LRTPLQKNVPGAARAGTGRRIARRLAPSGAPTAPETRKRPASGRLPQSSPIDLVGQLGPVPSLSHLLERQQETELWSGTSQERRRRTIHGLYLIFNRQIPYFRLDAPRKLRSGDGAPGFTARRAAAMACRSARIGIRG
jgi:hypothetical protein